MADSKTRLYGVWQAMLNRCRNPNTLYFKDYGGRGITVCSEWQSFAPFKAWATSNGYAAGLTIDRIDNDAGYSPGNCRWVSMAEQARNRRNNRPVTAFGDTLLMHDWTKDDRCKVCLATLKRRIDVAGWDPERAISTPPRPYRMPGAAECLQGHPLDEKNTLVLKTGERRCRTCNNQKARTHRMAVLA